MPTSFTVVGIGELLWDVLPTGRQLGGAPANVAYHSNVLGDRGSVLSRIGDDALGDDALNVLRRRGVDVSRVQRDDDAPTGTVAVSLDRGGQPTFVIAERVAWDQMAWTNDWRAVAAMADAVCFGTLAQRAPTSRNAIRSFLGAVPDACLIVFDVNLRQSFYDAGIIRASLQLSDVCKLNEQELPIVAELLGVRVTDALDTARRIIDAFGLRCMAVTRGGRGSVLMTQDDAVDHPGFAVTVRDTVGAGDAFAAGLIHGLLHRKSLFETSRIAAERGAWVAASAGAMPDPATFDASFGVAA